MSTWSYRVFKTDAGYGLFEVGNDDGVRNESPVSDAYYPTIEELKDDVRAMLAAFDQPVLEDKR